MKSDLKIVLKEPMFDLFGVNETGIVEFSFYDVVKIAGHACPTVAGSFLMALCGLKALWGEEIPTRGNVRLDYFESENSGVTGVISMIMGSIVGAQGIGGFKGLGGQFSRNNLVSFKSDGSSKVMMTRTDTGKSITIEYHPEIFPASREMSPLLSKILSNEANEVDKKDFRRLWNQRLDLILNAGADNKDLIKIY